MYEEGDSLFDGVAHRRYNESLDGWRNEQLDPADVPALQMVHAVINLFDEVNRLRAENWKLRKQLQQHK